MALLLLLLTFVGGQDAASALADRLAAATPTERAAILTAEGPTETLAAACRLLGARSYKDYQDGKFDRAIELNRFIASAADLLDLPRMKGAAYQMIGQSLGNQNKHAEALDAYALGLPYAVKAADLRLQAILWSMTGASLRILGRSEESRVAQETAVSLFKGAGLSAEAAQALNMLGSTVREMGQWQLAIDD